MKEMRKGWARRLTTNIPKRANLSKILGIIPGIIYLPPAIILVSCGLWVSYKYLNFFLRWKNTTDFSEAATAGQNKVSGVASAQNVYLPIFSSTPFWEAKLQIYLGKIYWKTRK